MVVLRVQYDAVGGLHVTITMNMNLHMVVLRVQYDAAR